MNIDSANRSALTLINNSHQKANEAAHDIATLSVDKEEVGGSKDFSATELSKPITQLKEAELENSAGVKVLQISHEMQKSIIDLFA